MWELDHKEGWASKNWCFQTVVLENTLKSLLNCKEIQTVHSKGNIPRYLLEGLMLKLQYFGHLMWRTDSLEKTVGKDGRQEEKGMTEDEMVGWPHQLNGHEFDQALGVGDGQGSLVCCHLWGCKELDTTEWLNWTEVIYNTYTQQRVGYQFS